MVDGDNGVARTVYAALIGNGYVNIGI